MLDHRQRCKVTGEAPPWWAEDLEIPVRPAFPTKPQSAPQNKKTQGKGSRFPGIIAPGSIESGSVSIATLVGDLGKKREGPSGGTSSTPFVVEDNEATQPDASKTQPAAAWGEFFPSMAATASKRKRVVSGPVAEAEVDSDQAMSPVRAYSPPASPTKKLRASSDLISQPRRAANTSVVGNDPFVEARRTSATAANGPDQVLAATAASSPSSQVLPGDVVEMPIHLSGTAAMCDEGASQTGEDIGLNDAEVDSDDGADAQLDQEASALAQLVAAASGAFD